MYTCMDNCDVNQVTGHQLELISLCDLECVERTEGLDFASRC